MFCSTQARPGSEEKIQTMIARYANSQPLWHPGDAFVGVTREDNGYGGPTANMPRKNDNQRIEDDEDEYGGES